MDSSHFMHLFSMLQDSDLTPLMKMDNIWACAAENFFTCLQVIMLQQLFKEEQAGFRVEVCVSLFSRTTDWRAYSYVLNYAGWRERNTARQRLGGLNLFFDGAATAVGMFISTAYLFAIFA